MTQKKAKLTLSPLGKTWLLDLDGTVVKHNGYKIDGHDTFLEGAREFLLGIPESDSIVFLTSRQDWCIPQTEEFLRAAGIRYDRIINNLPYGERIVVNDRKPSGLEVSVAVNLDRDQPFDLEYEIDGSLRSHSLPSSFFSSSSSLGWVTSHSWRSLRTSSLSFRNSMP